MLTEKLDILNIFNELSEKTELFEKTGLQFVQTRVYMQQLTQIISSRTGELLLLQSDL